MSKQNDPPTSSQRARAIKQDDAVHNDPLSKWYNPNYGYFLQPQTPYQVERFELDRRYGMHPSYPAQLASLKAKYGIKGGIRGNRKRAAKKRSKLPKKRQSSTSKRRSSKKR